NAEGRVGPVGRLKPNEFGLFDMHGSVWCWCQDPSDKYPRGECGKIVEDKEYDVNIHPQEHRVLRGASFTDLPENVHCSSRWVSAPDVSANIIGFRVARTIRAK